MPRRTERRNPRLVTAVCIVIPMLIAGSSQAFAQHADSLMFDTVTVAAEARAMLSLDMYNQATLKAMSMPFVYPTDKVKFDSLSWAGGRVDYIAAKTLTHNAAAGELFLGVLPILEPLIAPGRGEILRLYFELLPGALPGETIVIDSQRIPPSGDFILSDDANNPVPFEFQRGVIEVMESNTAPTMNAPAEVFVNEGELLQFAVSANDVDGDSLILSVSGAPVGAAFVDSGNGIGVFEWTPEFVGPNSSTNSPYAIQFHVSDGTDNDQAATTVNVANVNRPPVITVPESDSVAAGDLVSFEFSGADPDADMLTPSMISAPTGAGFTGTNPWTFEWQSTEADSGVHTTTIVITDDFGEADTGTVTITVTALPPIIDFALTILDTNSLLGGTVIVPVYLQNDQPIGGFDLLIEYDLSALNLSGVTFEGTRVENFELLTPSYSTQFGSGRIRLVGIADQNNGVITPPLGVGNGPIAFLEFWVTDDGAFVDQFVPVTFLFLDEGDNVLSDPSGDITYMQEAIDFDNGGVLIKQVIGVLLGDINLNGVPEEIGDAVRFANYFINASQYPLDDHQRANSDVNQDGLTATVGDLVYLINQIVGISNVGPPPDVSDAGKGGQR